MWIFCAGMRRSGSTLQFQLTAHLVEQAGRGARVEPATPDEFPRLQADPAGQDGWKVFKTHRRTDEMLAELQGGNAKGVYVYRDVRDVIVSRINRSGRSFERIWKESLDSVLESFEQWTSLDAVLVSRYEDMVADVAGEVRRIAAHLDIAVSREESQEIAAQYTPARQLERIREAQETGLVERSPRVAFDPVSNLHVNHIRSGQSEQWSTALSRRQLALVEGRAEGWLVAHGYRLSLPRWQRPILRFADGMVRQGRRLKRGRRGKGTTKSASR